MKEYHYRSRLPFLPTLFDADVCDTMMMCLCPILLAKDVNINFMRPSML